MDLRDLEIYKLAREISKDAWEIYKEMSWQTKKVIGDQFITAGGIIIRQRGTKFHPGDNVGIGNDDTLYALKTGMVKFQEKKVKAFTGNKDRRTFVHVTPIQNSDKKEVLS